MSEKSTARILQVVVLNMESGVASLVMNLYRNMDPESVRFDFVTWGIDPKYNYIEEIRNGQSQVFVIPHYKNGWRPFNRAIRAILAENQYDGIHCHEYLAGLPFLFWAKQRGIPLRIAHSHNPTIDGALKRKLTMFSRALFKRTSTDFMACSKEAGDFLFGKKVRTEIIDNGIDVSRYRFSNEVRNRLRDKLSFSGKLVVGHIGRMAAQKNQMFLLSIFAEITSLCPDAVLLMIGEGELETELRREAKRLGIIDKIYFLGLRRDIPQLLQVMDVFLLPSLYEGLPFVLVEAQAGGLPCIVSDAVTPEAKMNDHFRFLPLGAGAKEWALAALREAGKTIMREEEKISFSRFDIRRTAERVQEKYLEQVRKKNQHDRT